MPRTFPSQIVAYLGTMFAPHNPVHDFVGAALGFLDLYKNLPPELIRLPPEDFAALVAAVGTVQLGVDQFRSTAQNDSLQRVGPALNKAQELIAKLKDEVPSTSHDLAFIGDPLLQEMIGLDISAVTTDLQSGEWKGATIIAGSCCEALLLYGLQTRDGKTPGTVAKAVSAIRWPGKSPNPSNATDRSWDLFSYAEVCCHLGLISDSTKAALDLARDYRNLIHPAKTVREKIRCDRGTAYIAVGALEHVITDTRNNL
jgi:hypothetical protein